MKNSSIQARKAALAAKIAELDTAMLKLTKDLKGLKTNVQNIARDAHEEQDAVMIKKMRGKIQRN